MKLLKGIIVILLFGALASVLIVFWPKIRECCDQWMACKSDEGAEEAPIVPVEES